MIRTSITQPLFLILCVVFVLGCSTKVQDNVLLPDSDDNYTVNLVETDKSPIPHQLWGTWQVVFDPDSLTASVTPNRILDAHYNITSLIPNPIIVVNSYDPIAEVIDVDVSIENPYLFDAYDVRSIIYTDSVGHKLRNADDWTPLYDIAGGLPINPFKAYAKHIPNRKFAGKTDHTENLLIYCPGSNFNVQFAIDASFPGNCTEPYEICNFSQGVLYSTIGSSTEIEVTVRDWQNDTNAVYLHCPQITGLYAIPLSQFELEKWTATLSNNMGASAGSYVGYFYATSLNSGSLPLYDEINIIVTGQNIPSDPVVVGSLSGYSHGIWYDGDYVYSAGGYAGLKIVDVSNPLSPFIVGSVITDEEVNDVECSGDYAYIVDWEALYSVDINNPMMPAIVGSVPMFEGYRVDIKGDYAYVAWIGFSIVDISTPTSPEWLSDLYIAVCFDVEVSGNYAYVATGHSGLVGLYIVDVSNPSNPLVVSSNSQIPKGMGVDVSGNYVYVTDERSGKSLYILDVSDPAYPQMVGTLYTGTGNDVAIYGDYAYVMDSGGGIIIVDVSDPTSPSIFSSLDTSGESWDIAFNDNYAYLADGSGGIKVIKLWD